MEKKKRLFDIIYVPLCVVLSFVLYVLCNTGNTESIFGIIFGKLMLFFVMTVWICSAYSYVRQKFVSVTQNLKTNIVAVIVTSLSIPTIFWFVVYCLKTLEISGNNIIDMITEAPVYYVKYYFMSKFFLRIVFWFAYCCLMCVLVCLNERYNWSEKIIELFGYVDEEKIVQVKGNSLVLPFDYNSKSFKLYFAVNGKGMLVDEEFYNLLKENAKKNLDTDPADEQSMKFLELIDSAVEFAGEDKRIFRFDEAHGEMFKYDTYIIEEEDGWYELTPVVFTGKNKKTHTLFKKILSFSFAIPLIIFSEITSFLLEICSKGIGYGFEDFISGMKYISYVSLMYTVSSFCNIFIVNKESSKTKKILTCIVSTLVVLTTIILLNSAYHFLVFNNLFNRPENLTYFMFLKNDMLYHEGIGAIRFPAVVLLYLAIYFFRYCRVAEKWWKNFKSALIESLLSDEK